MPKLLLDAKCTTCGHVTTGELIYGDNYPLGTFQRSQLVAGIESHSEKEKHYLMELQNPATHGSVGFARKVIGGVIVETMWPEQG